MSSSSSSSYMWVRERRPDNPIKTLEVAKARVADCEDAVSKLKVKLEMIQGLKSTDPAMYLRYLQTKKLEELEKQVPTSEAMLAGWNASAVEAERDIPIFEDLVKKAQRWIDGHAEAEKKAATTFRAKITAIQTERDQLLAQFGTHGWASPPELEKVRGKDLMLRTMVLQLGASPPPTMKYTWDVENPGKRTYDL